VLRIEAIVVRAAKEELHSHSKKEEKLIISISNISCGGLSHSVICLIIVVTDKNLNALNLLSPKSFKIYFLTRHKNFA